MLRKYTGREAVEEVSYKNIRLNATYSKPKENDSMKMNQNLFYSSSNQMAFSRKHSRPLIHHQERRLELRNSALGIGDSGSKSISWNPSTEYSVNALSWIQDEQT